MFFFFFCTSILSLTLPFRKWRRVCQGLVSCLELVGAEAWSLDDGRRVSFWDTIHVLSHNPAWVHESRIVRIVSQALLPLVKHANMHLWRCACSRRGTKHRRAESPPPSTSQGRSTIASAGRFLVTFQQPLRSRLFVTDSNCSNTYRMTGL